MILRNLVRQARKRAGLTQVALAKRANVAQSTIARIESGTRIPSTDMVERLIRATGLEIRVGLQEADHETRSLFERTLQRSPEERLADATHAARFVLRGRRAIQYPDDA